MDDIIKKGKLKEVKAVTPLDDYKLLLEFKTGEKRLFDVKPLLEMPVFKPLQNKEFFNQVHVIYDYTIAWNNDIDMCPDTLYISSVPAGGIYQQHDIR